MKSFMWRTGIGRTKAWALLSEGLPHIQCGGRGSMVKLDPAAVDAWLIRRYGSIKAAKSAKV
jgi:hypothetical protein